MSDTAGIFDVARVYGDAPRVSGRAVLVDRLWPRGIARDDAPFDDWLKDVAPSTELRRWFGHSPDRFDEFTLRYRQELQAGAARDAAALLREWASAGHVTLVTATKDVTRSSATVLRDFLRSH
ncbi:MAG: DUF488 family protein [Acidobacteria bacterium]|nr:DUF488 family protein [Acidobacteriota bacterium]